MLLGIQLLQISNWLVWPIWIFLFVQLGFRKRFIVIIKCHLVKRNHVFKLVELEREENRKPWSTHQWRGVLILKTIQLSSREHRAWFAPRKSPAYLLLILDNTFFRGLNIGSSTLGLKESEFFSEQVMTLRCCRTLRYFSFDWNSVHLQHPILLWSFAKISKQSQQPRCILTLKMIHEYNVHKLASLHTKIIRTSPQQ